MPDILQDEQDSPQIEQFVESTFLQDKGRTGTKHREIKKKNPQHMEKGEKCGDHKLMQQEYWRTGLENGTGQRGQSGRWEA